MVYNVFVAIGIVALFMVFTGLLVSMDELLDVDRCRRDLIAVFGFVFFWFIDYKLLSQCEPAYLTVLMVNVFMLCIRG